MLMKKRTWVMLAVIILSSLFDLLSWQSPAFSDFYTIHIFPLWGATYGRLTSLFPFSVGEVLIIAGLCWLGILFVLSILILVNTLHMHLRRSSGAPAFRHFYAVRRAGISFYQITAWLLSGIFMVMSLNCFVLYHCTPFSSEDSAGSGHDGYTQEELASVRDYIVTNADALALAMPRDAQGNIVYTGNMEQSAIASMQKLGQINPRLSGFYVTPKALTFSGFMSQQYMQGYYFPFSMEANYNNIMNITNKPFTMCHELAHTHGYIYEDEANMIGYLACISSDDAFFRYSGYLGLLNYVNNDYYKAVSRSEYNSHVAISDLVKKDNRFLTDASWNQVEKKAVVKTETVRAAASTFVDTNLKVNGVSSGKVSYTHVVGLLLDYYYEEGNADVLLADAS